MFVCNSVACFVLILVSFVYCLFELFGIGFSCFRVLVFDIVFDLVLGGLFVLMVDVCVISCCLFLVLIVLFVF